ncbi:39S ribosomal protein L54, mitochondrial-like [Mizuhopecten yessoensis]|uniref:Large ribosomal subunit protein mL54 n=1 Tax=Mizuhopecten yessoensis TaxID=6573 RepID=A0A210Q5J8_MIZYE|nr:39S ribosomal protein L54, mitochondrial-like [Mizuhopecten yessoensis]OWF44007.1 39S ribosomal protein L54, mitochondrial [Mizuhopecten yessoensis]
MATALCTCLRKIAICPLRCWQNGYMITAAYAKAPVPAIKVKLGFEVEKDPHKLVNYLCGGNIYKTGEEIELKPEEEYPDWLWELRIDRKAPDLEQLEYGSYEYWAKAKKLSLKSKNAMQKMSSKRKHKKF